MTHLEPQPNRDQGRHAVVGILCEQDRFLVIRRSQWVRAPGLICFPGGGIEQGEDIPTAARRELLEELGLEVEVHEHLWTSVTRWGTRLEWVRCSRSAVQEPVPAPSEVAEVLWLGAHELAKRDDLLGSMPDFLKAFRSGQFAPYLVSR
jgi:8-oxo-dGTP pyrophosphatase MutT (NUDIX family)